MPTPEQIDCAVKAVAPEFDGMSGNCARFAAVLNKVVGGEGAYLLVESGHYELSDHVYLSHEGHYYDSTGMCSLHEIEQLYPEAAEEADEDEDDGEYYVEDGYTLEEFSDPSAEGDMIRRTADSSNPMAAQWHDEDLEAALLAAFADLGAVFSRTDATARQS
ncbi:hypothetical protein G6L37_05375 [Agrobacterium rubi]|nr:hypothetical protein [Agrobacterium rubi]NTF24788.1 hypothetical protein [Agrobacterium rubi]